MKIPRSEPKLPFPLIERSVVGGRLVSEEYEIPEEKRLDLLLRLYPFEECPELDDERFDLHAQRSFTVRDYKVVREDGLNYLVSPYYYEDGGTVIDWVEGGFCG